MHGERWKSMIQSAADAEGVTDIVRGYVQSIMPSDLVRLPPACQSLLARAIHDICGSAVDFTREELRFTSEPDAEALLHEIAHTFIAACNRLRQIEVSSRLR